MRIALTHNLRLSDSEEEAEFDTEETVNALAAAIERLGHRVEKMEVSGPASRTVARLEAFSPDLIFNTAEGRRGRQADRPLGGGPTAAGDYLRLELGAPSTVPVGTLASDFERRQGRARGG